MIQKQFLSSNPTTTVVFFVCLFVFRFLFYTQDVRSEVPRAKMWHERVLFYIFSMYLMSRTCCCGGYFFFQVVYFLHNRRLLFQPAGVRLSVSSWKLIYSVGKSSACAMIENTWMSGQIGERVWFYVSVLLLGLSCRYRGLLHTTCTNVHANDRVLSIHLLHQRFWF